MLITKLELCWLLLAQTVKSAGPNSSVAIPVMAPVVLLNSRPAGIDGWTSQDSTSPPIVIGARETWVTFTVRSIEESGYDRNMLDPLIPSSASQIPSESASFGVEDESM